MASIFDFSNYKEFVRHWISVQPKNGRGALKRFAEALGVHSTLMSQIINGSRDLSLEQALELAEVIQLTEFEKKYFLLLVQIEKAGTAKLGSLLLEEARRLRDQNDNLKNKFPHKAALDEKTQARFYSDWSYSAIRLATDLKDIKSPSDIADLLHLPLSMVKERLDFLVETGMCRIENGHYKMGLPVTHVARNSPFVLNHHKNWRLKSLEKGMNLTSSDFVFTAPVSISKSGTKEISTLLSKLVDRLKEIAVQSEAEELRVLNLDWISFADPNETRN